MRNLTSLCKICLHRHVDKWAQNGASQSIAAHCATQNMQNWIPYSQKLEKCGQKSKILRKNP